MSDALYDEQVDAAISAALAEDLGRGDATTDALIPPELRGKATILIKGDGVLAGIGVAKKVFLSVDPSLVFETLIEDGAAVKKGDAAATISGRVAGMLKAERTAMNFLQRMSGIATRTAEYVSRAPGAVIKDTRKTAPGLRHLEKYAVRMGGGRNHRMDLSDGILIKDNHLVALRALGLGIADAVAKAKRVKGQTVEVEATNEQEVREAVAAGADMIMFDNMTPDEMARARKLVPKGIRTEASGGVNIDNVQAVAATGVDDISVGALTHSVKALNISLELDAVGE